MNEILQQIADLFTLLFVLTTMISMGLGLTVKQIISPLKNIRFLITSLGINFIIVPLVAYLMAMVFSLEDALKTGLILVGVAAGAPALPKLAEIAKTNIATAVSLMGLLMVVSIAFIPLVLPLMLPDVEVDAGAIARGLLLQMLLPLGLALIVRAFFEDLADTLKPFMTQASSISLLIMIVLTIALNFQGVIDLYGSGGLLASLIVIIVAIGAGYLIGGPTAGDRQIQLLGASQRNIAAAMVVVTANFSSEPDVLVMVVTFSLITLVLVAPIASIFGRRKAKEST